MRCSQWKIDHVTVYQSALEFELLVLIIGLHLNCVYPVLVYILTVLCARDCMVAGYIYEINHGTSDSILDLQSKFTTDVLVQ